MASPTALRPWTKSNDVSASTLPQRRTFFDFNMLRKPKRERKDADMDPGIAKMMELEKLQRMRARLPSEESVLNAVHDFLDFKGKGPIEDTHATLVLQSLRYCQKLSGDGGGLENGSVAEVDGEVYSKIARVLSLRPKDVSTSHVQLAKLAWDRLESSGPDEAMRALRSYCRALCWVREPEAALQALLQLEKIIVQDSGFQNNEDLEDADGRSGAHDRSSDRRAANGLSTPLEAILRDFVNLHYQPGIERTLSIMRQHGIDESEAMSRPMMEYGMFRNNLQEVERWWETYKDRSPQGPGNSLRHTQTINKLIRWCLRSQNLRFGHEVVRTAMTGFPLKAVWDSVFVWAAGTGKGVDEIGRMFDVMKRSNEDPGAPVRQRLPDATTVNALVEFAISKRDPYMAERFMVLGQDHGIEPDASTYVLQMDYRLDVNDIDGALTAYKNLQAMAVSGDEDLPAVNRLVVALCASKRHDFDTVMNVVADLSERQSRFEPLTTSTLTLLHLDRDEIHDVIDLLNTHAFHYSSAERASIRGAMVSYCLNPSTPTSRAWDAYTIIRDVFDELDRTARTELMTSFFKRERPDMAVHVFNHMRTHSRTDTMPTIDTYISAFLGAARLRDLESLEVLHNQLKLDFNINVSTSLRNALIIGYTACHRPRKALGFWDEIVASKEGPTYNSIHIAMRACEHSPFGDLKAKEIWERLRKTNVDLDGTIWASYVAALAGNGNVKASIKTVEEAEAKNELEVDKFVLGSLFDGAPGMDKQGDVEAWGKARYPREWAKLERMGVEENEVGTRAFKIDRSVTP